VGGEGIDERVGGIEDVGVCVGRKKEGRMKDEGMGDGWDEG